MAGDQVSANSSIKCLFVVFPGRPVTHITKCQTPPGNTRNPKVFGLDPSAVLHHRPGASLGRRCALPALQASNHAFSKDFQGFQETVSFIRNHERQSWAYIISTPGTTRKHKEFQGFEWDPSAVSHRGLEASMDRPCALPALQAGNLHFSKHFEGFQETVSFVEFRFFGLRPEPENDCFSTVFRFGFSWPEFRFFLATYRGAP